MLKRLIFCALMVLSCVPSACMADNTTGTNGSACQFYPTLGVGNGDNTCVGNTKAYYQQTSPATHCTSTANTIAPGNMSTAALADDPNYNSTLFATYQSGTGTYVPGICGMTLGTGAITAGAAFATACSDSSGHNVASIVQLGQGYIAVPYCGESTPQACMTASGGAGSASHCQYVSVGNTIGGGTANVDITAATSQHVLPVPGISEGTSARYGNEIVVTGQAQRSIGASIPQYVAGSATYLAMQSLATAGQFTVDSACSQGGAITAYNPITMTNIATQLCSGGQQWSILSHDDSMYQLLITTDASGQTITLNFPAVQSFPGATCTYTTTSSTPSTDIGAIVTDITNGTGLTGTNCSSVNTAYGAVAITNTQSSGTLPWTTPCDTGANCFAVYLKHGNPVGVSITAASCGGTLVCTYTQLNLEGGTHSLFQWGGTRMLVDRFGTPHWFELFDQEVAASPTHNSPTQAGSVGINLVVFCAIGMPTNGVWTWGDVTCGQDGYSFTMSPALLTTNLIHQLGNGGGGSATTSAVTEYSTTSSTITAYPIIRPCTCTPPGTLNPFIYNYASTAMPAISAAPTASAKDITYDSNGNLFIVYGCYDTSGNLQACYVDVNTTTGNTFAQGFVESGNTSGNQQLTVAVTTSPAGTIIADISTGNCGVYAGCTSTNGTTAIFRYTSTNNGTTWAKSLVKQFKGGTNSPAAGSACNIFDTIDGDHIYQFCTQPGAYTAGSAVFDFYDEYTGNQ